jgi:hypothetical protein
MPLRSAGTKKQATALRHKPDWKANDQLAVIDVSPWGEGICW